MSKVTESRTYNVTLTPEEARAIIVLDSYTLRGPLRELSEALQNYEGEPDGGELTFDVYDNHYEEQLDTSECVIINFSDLSDWGY